MLPADCAVLDEVAKLAAKGAVELLTSMAKRKGVDVNGLGALKQVGNIAAAGNRPRAAEVARNVRGFLRQEAQGAHAAGA